MDTQLEARVTAAADLQRERAKIGDSLPDISLGILSEELARSRALEELLAGWASIIWGSNSNAITDQEIEALRAPHSRAQVQVEQAWKDVVQLAAESLTWRNA